MVNFSFDILLGFTVLTIFSNLFLSHLIIRDNVRSWTNRFFILLCVTIVLWTVTTYFSELAAVAKNENAIFLVRLVLFFVVPFDFFIFSFIYNFPDPKLSIRKVVFLPLILFALATAFLVLSPFVFSGIEYIGNGSAVPIPGDYVFIFALYVFLFAFLSFFVGIKKLRESRDIQKEQWKYILYGLLSMYVLLISSNFLAVIVFNNSNFIKYGPLMTLPFVVMAMYAILEHRLLYLKVVPTKILVFAVLSFSFLGIFIAPDLGNRLLAFGIFSMLLVLGVCLVSSVTREVEQREQLEELTKQLQAANKKLEELSAYKTQLLSLASHQTKSPLSAIKSYASLLIQGLFGEVNDQVKDKLNKIMLASDQLLSLIDTFLNLRKVEEGKMDYKMTKTDLVQLIKGKADELQPLTQSKNLGYEINLPDHPVMVSADAQKLQQILQNFIDNAIKYTPEGKVTINLKEEGGYVIFSVHDSGYGIPADLLPHLFEEYMRDERIKNKVRGTGFGLFIARKIAEAHGGTTWAESEGENKGSTFYLKLKKVDNS